MRPPLCPRCHWPMRSCGSGFGAEGTRVARTETFVCPDHGHPTLMLYDRNGMELTGEDFAAGNWTPDRLLDSEVDE